MGTYTVKILNPKAEKLLQDLADLELISLSNKETIYLSPEQKEMLTVSEEDIAYGRVVPDEELGATSIRKTKDPFLAIVNKIRKQAKNNPLTLDEITEEVEKVRTERYARKKA